MKKCGKVLLGLTASAALIGGLAYLVKKVLNPEIVLKDLDKTNSENKACNKNVNVQDVSKDIPKVEQMSGAAMIKALAGESQNTPDVTEERIFTLQEADKTSSETLADATKKVEAWKEKLDSTSDDATNAENADTSFVDMDVLPIISKAEMMQHVEQNMSALEESIQSRDNESEINIEIEFSAKDQESLVSENDSTASEVEEPASETAEDSSNLPETELVAVSNKETAVEEPEEVDDKEETSLADMIRDVNAQNSAAIGKEDADTIPGEAGNSDSNTASDDEDLIFIDLDEED